MKSPGIDVSRETIDLLQRFGELTHKWTQKINLVSKNDANHIWERHILDSCQLYPMAPPSSHWLDLGSGGGFPGIVIGILNREQKRHSKVTLVESDQRKCAFLRTAVRELQLDVHIVSERIESLPNQHAEVLSARALSDLDALLEYANLHLSLDGMALFPKGGNWKTEHAKAQRRWSYGLEVVTSATQNEAAVLKIQDIKRV